MEKVADMSEEYTFAPGRNTVCTVEEAHKAFTAGAARFVDARWYMPNDPRNVHEAYQASHLPGAVFLDIDKVSSASEAHPHLMPSAQTMASWLGENGFSPSDPIIIYDDTGLFTAPRGWWMLKSLGHGPVWVMEGGLNGWVAAGLPVSSETVNWPASPYPLPHASSAPASRSDVARAITDKHSRLVDGRPEGRFTGTAPEPRPGLSSGHMPGAVNVPFSSLANPDGSLKSSQELEAIFAAVGLRRDDDIIATCGSGITACVPLLALSEIGWAGRLKLYDGSWIDWASQPDAPIAKLG